MNKNKTLLALTAAFILLLGGAYILYNRLAQDAAPDQLLATDSAQQSEQHADPQTDVSQEETPAPESETQEPPKVPAPDFTVYDADGTEVHLSDFIGKPIILNFWASWCGPCQREMPDFHETYLEQGEEISFLMVNATTGRETLESAKAFIDASGYSFPVFYDTDADASMTYGAYSLPTTYFIDAEGNVIVRATGAIDGETLQRGIDMIT